MSMPLLPSVLALLRESRAIDRCVLCGKPLAPREESLRMRGGSRVHRRCATYRMRRRREGLARLGFPPR